MAGEHCTFVRGGRGVAGKHCAFVEGVGQGRVWQVLLLGE